MNVAGLDHPDAPRGREHQMSDRDIALEPRPVLHVQLVVDAHRTRDRPGAGDLFDVLLDLPYRAENAPDRLTERGGGVLHAVVELTEAAVPGVAGSPRSGAALQEDITHAE